MSAPTHTAVSEYLSRTQAALADLPAAEVEEILEDIGPHLAEVAEELGEDVSVEALIERLGTPEEYASELRTAAGYPPAEPAPKPARELLSRLALWLLVAGALAWYLAGMGGLPNPGLAGLAIALTPLLLVAWFLIFTGRAPAIAELAESRFGRRVLDGVPAPVMNYLRALRPAWWLVRIVALITGVVLARGPEYPVLAVAALVVLAVFGGRGRSDAGWRWVVAPANAFAVGLTITLLVGGLLWATESLREPAQPVVYSVPEPPHNFYPFGPDGKPLPEVYLYDENGQPISGIERSCAHDYGRTTNKFPQPRIEYDSEGGCHEVTGVPFPVAIPTPNPPAPSTTTMPAPSTTTAPPSTSAPPPSTK
jgi:uncharacterized membrane protein